MTATATKLRTRRPTGVVPWPLVLIEGEEGAGKTYSAALFSASPRIGQMYWIDLSEGSADEYVALPGADYLIIEHDGTYRDILEQVEAVHAEARRAAAAGEPPVVLVIDSASALWRMLTNWTQERARRTKKARTLLREDPDASVDVTMNLWNDAVERWQRVIHLLQTLPGIAVVLARGKQVSVVDDHGNPVNGRKEWKVSGHKDLGFDCSVWVRLKRDEDAQVVKARSLRLRVEPGRPHRLPDFSIDSLVFDLLGCSPQSQPRVMPALTGDRVMPWLERVQTLTEQDALKELWRAVHPDASGLTREEAATVQAAIMRRKEELDSPRHDLDEQPPSDADRLRAAVQRRDEADRTDDRAQASSTATA